MLQSVKENKSVKIIYKKMFCLWRRAFLFCPIFQVELDPNSGIFITLNPAGKGYGGRQKLPDNLKQLFRPVAMSRPDNELIAEVILYSEGFKNGEVLGRKLVAIFNLAR